jgi:hypothetical protein
MWARLANATVTEIRKVCEHMGRNRYDPQTDTDGKMLDNVARSAIEFRQYDFDYA